MAGKIYQNIKKNKDGKDPKDVYYTFNADQSSILYVEDGRWNAEKGVLSVQLKPSAEGDYEVMRFENKKPAACLPYEWPLLLNIKVDTKEGSTQEKALGAFFSNPEYSALAAGFKGIITWSDTPGAKALAAGEGIKSHYWESFAELVPHVSTIADSDISTGGNSWTGGGAKSQTEAERLSDRMSFVSKCLTADTPESTVIKNIATALESELTAVLHMILS